MMFCLGILKSRKFLDCVNAMQRWMLSGYVLSRRLSYLIVERNVVSLMMGGLWRIHIGVGYALLVLHTQAMREPQNADKQNCRSAFLYVL